jgi:ankyrin repeat protein
MSILVPFDPCSIETQLISMEGCPKRTCDNGYTALHEAARNASSKALEALITYGKAIQTGSIDRAVGAKLLLNTSVMVSYR